MSPFLKISFHSSLAENEEVTFVNTIKNGLLAAAGGSAGAYLRYVISLQMQSIYGTFIVNMLGSFLLGFISAYFLYKNKQRMQLILGTGFCGGFTTMSTFAGEINKLNFTSGGIYLLVSLSLGLVLAWTGYAAGGQLAVKKEEGE